MKHYFLLALFFFSVIATTDYHTKCLECFYQNRNGYSFCWADGICYSNKDASSCNYRLGKLLTQKEFCLSSYARCKNVTFTDNSFNTEVE